MHTREKNPPVKSSGSACLLRRGALIAPTKFRRGSSQMTVSRDFLRVMGSPSHACRNFVLRSEA
jgi:hypothetical protein